MPRPRRPNGPPSRARSRFDGPPVFVRRPELARITSTTEGFWRQLEQRPGSPPVVKVGKVTLYELAPTLDWIRRNAVSA